MDAVVATIGAGELAMASRQPPSVGSALVRDATLLKNDQMNQFQSSFFCVEFFLFSAEGSFVTNIHARTIWRRRKKKKWIIGTLPFLFSALPSFTSSSESVFFFFLFCLGGWWSSYNIVLSLWIILDSVHVCLTCVCCSRIWISTFWRMMLYARCTYNVQRTTYIVHIRASVSHSWSRWQRKW